MNGKTAKLIRKATLVSLASHGAPEVLTRDYYRRAVKRVKAHWKGTPKDKRGSLRRSMERVATI